MHPRDKGAPLGPPVPLEALDPGFPYEPALAHDLLAQFLPTLDTANNPFLRSAEEMTRLGFQGTPGLAGLTLGLDMALPIPRHIAAANLDDAMIRYQWDDWNVEQAEEPIDKDFYKRLEGISQRANAALTIASAEWIVHRFAPFADVSLALQYVEAAWAQIVDFRYGSGPWDAYVDEGEWGGPVLRPIWTAMYRIQFALEVAKDDEAPELRAAWITRLAPYLMTIQRHTKSGLTMSWLGWRASIAAIIERPWATSFLARLSTRTMPSHPK